MADYGQESYQELVAIKELMLNSVRAILDEGEKQTNALISITDLLREDQNKPPEANASTTANKPITNLFTDAFSKGFKIFVDTLPNFFKGIKKFEDVDTEGFTKFISEMNKALTLDGVYEDYKEMGLYYEKVGKTYDLLGGSIGKFSKGLIVFATANKLKAPDAFMKFTERFFDEKYMKKLDPKKAKEAGMAYVAMGAGILKFSASVALSTPLLLIGMPAIVIALPIMMGLSAYFAMLGKFARPIDRGADAMRDIGLGLLAFTGSLVMMRFVRPEDFMVATMAIGLFTLFMGAMMLVSQIGGPRRMEHNAKAILAVSLGLGVFALAVMAYRFVEPRDLLMAGGAMLVLATTMWILGKAGPGVMMGALAMGVAAISMGVAAYVIQMFEDVTEDQLIKAGLTVAGITAAIYALSNPMALAGAAALAGVALAFSYSFGLIFDALARFKESGWNESDTEVLSGTISGLLTGIAAPITSGNLLDGILTVVGGAAGSGVLTMLGIALLPLTHGLKVFKESGFTEKDAAVMGSVFTILMDSITEPIEHLGASATFWTRSDFARGVSSLKGLGGVMYELADGVRAMSKLTFIDPITGKEVPLKQSDFENAGANVTAIITAIKDPISEIGRTVSTGAGDGSILGRLTHYFSETDFENGMEAVGGLGSLIVDLAEGVMKMASMTFKDPVTGKMRTLNEADFKKSGENIKAILTAVKEPISEIGRTTTAGGGSGFFGKVARYFSEPDFENGMEAIQGLGSEIVNMADGVMKMASMSFTDPVTGETRTLTQDDFTKAGANIHAILTAVKDPISDIGASGGWFTDSDFAEGMDSIRGLGKEMVDLADGVRKMSLMTFVDPTDPTRSIKLEQSHFEDAGKNIVAILDAIKGPISKFGESGWFKKPAFKKGLDALHGTGDELLKLTESMVKIQELQSKNFTVKDSSDYITGVVKAFTGPFDGGKLKVADAETITGSYRKMIDDVVKLSKRESSLGKVAGHLESISESMIKVVTAFEGITTNKLTAGKEFFDSLVEIEKINADTFKAKLQKTQELIEGMDEANAAQPIAASNAAQNDLEQQRLDKMEEQMSMLKDMMSGIYELLGNINSTLQNNTLKVDVVSMEKDIDL